MITPAMQIPRMIHGTAVRKGILNRYAATDPVQAPVIGAGIATNNIRPSVLYLFINLLRLTVRLNNQVKKRSAIGYLRRFRSAGLSNNKMGKTGTKLPHTAMNHVKNGWVLPKLFASGDHAYGIAPLSSNIGNIAIKKVATGGGNCWHCSMIASRIGSNLSVKACESLFIWNTGTSISFQPILSLRQYQRSVEVEFF